jgi:hypothetical protein
MKKLIALFLLLTALPAPLLSTTAPDLRSRITVDGVTEDFEDDEWVLDDSTEFREIPDDSRWGQDNDIRRIAVTWDNYNLYVAIPAVTVSTKLMLFLDTMCGGVEDLTRQDYFRRNIEFGGMTPNFVLQTDRTSAEPLSGYLDCTRPFNLIENRRYQALYLQDGVRDGALEAAIPWETLGDFRRETDGVYVPSDGAVLGILAVVTGGQSTGAGDAAPDPSVVLENDSTRIAVLDNHIGVPLDGDADGILDIGVSPRLEASYAISSSAQGTTAPQVFPLRVPLEQKVFSTTDSGRARFPVTLDSAGYTEPVYLTARIFGADGQIVRTVWEEQPTDFPPGGGTVWIEWDLRKESGEVVPGGVYIFAVSGGAGKGTSKNTAKAAFAVVW